MPDTLQCLIIGSGPAGYTAAIYAARADMNPELYTGLEPGGQLTTTTEVENFPGYPQGITGPEMMTDLQNQAERFGTKVHYDMITKVEFSKEIGGIHKATTAGGKEILTHTIIISTGATAKYLGLESEQRLRGGGVSACATCDGFFYKGKDVVVVGGGDTAIEEATYLAKLCKKVYLLVRKDSFRASKTMQHRASTTANLEILFNHEIDTVLGDNVVTGILAVNNTTQEKRELIADGLFLAIGHTPNTQIFEGLITLDETGYIVTEKGTTKTNIPGIFAAGDVQDKTYRQAITAAGSGCMAALDAEKFLAEHVH